MNFNLVLKFILLATMCNSNCKAQNLIPNGDFNISNCPKKDGELKKAIGWYSPTIGSTDHFHLCGDNDAKIGKNIRGYQLPYKGYGYADFGGLYIYINLYGDTLYHLSREYLQCELSDNLVVGAYYRYSMRVSLADKSEYAINSFGVDFTTNAYTDYSSDSYLPIYKEPLIEFNETVSDTLNWVLLQDTIRVSDKYQFVTIGVFADSSEVILTRTNFTDIYLGQSDYYIDDIQLYKIRDPLLITKDTSFCIDYQDSIVLKATTGFADYAWYDSATNVLLQTGDSLVKVKPDVTTTYMVIAEQDTSYATITLNPLPQFTLGPDSNLCSYDTINLSSGLDVSSVQEYQWQDNTTSSIFKAKVSTTTVWHQVTDTNGCVWRDTINLTWQTPPEVELSNDTLTCEGTTTDVRASATLSGVEIWTDDYNLTWQSHPSLSTTSDSTVKVNPTTNTMYYTTVDDGKCTGNTDSVLISIKSNPLTSINPKQQTICKGVQTEITATGGQSYLWNISGSTGIETIENKRTISSNNSTFIAVQAIDVPCRGEWDTAFITVDTTEVTASFEVSPVEGFTTFEPVVLNTSTGGETYTWDFSNGVTTTVTSADDAAQNRTYYPKYTLAGTYQLNLRAERYSGCADSVSRSILVHKKFILEIPNAFTPNDDGLNETFNIITSDGVTIQGSIYNRWGERVYEWNTANEQFSWDGNYKEKPAQSGVYVFMLKLIEPDNTIHHKKGTVTLLR